MDTAHGVLQAISSASFGALGLLTIVLWLRRGGRQNAWAAAAFASIGIIVLVGLLLPEDGGEGLGYEIFVKAILVLLFAFPYFLYRFATSFRPQHPAWGFIAAVLTIAATAPFLFITLPGPDEDPPSWFRWLAILIAVQWTYLFVSVAVALWRGGRGQPTLSRRRMRVMAVAAAALDLVIVIGVIVPTERGEVTVTQLVTSSIGILAALLFGLGFAPPKLVRTTWRLPEQDALLHAVEGMLLATSTEEVTSTILPHTAKIMGGSGAALVSPSGALLGQYGTGLQPEDLRGNGHTPTDPSVLRVPLKGGALVVRASPYSPYFGREEVTLLRSLGNLADLALERSAVYDREREFIANAAHELRTPLTAITGLTATLTEYRARLTDDQVEEVLEGLGRQCNRATTLVNNLLDLARLTHETIELRATDLAVVIDRVMAALPPPEGKNVRVNVPPESLVHAAADSVDQVLVNVLRNAYRYGGPNVSVDAVTDATTLRLSITDDGPGVDPDLAPILFDAFTRGTTGQGSGSGLGLTISRRLAEAMGGSIRYETPEGGGSRFVLTFRRA
ncbi:MAG TPA: HAMP domain-containing sensor histidine kinase [Actinomycetota bacterium]